jgi:carbonic anhydrase
VSITDELLENTAGHAWAFTHGALPRPPAKRVAVLACMDACLNVYGILGFEEPDGGVLRAVGGVVSDDAIGSLLASQRLLGLGENVLIHHPDCGVLTLDDDEVKVAVVTKTGPAPVFALLALADLDRDVRRAGARSRRAVGAVQRRSPQLRLRGCHGALREVLSAKAGPSGVIDFEPYGRTLRPIGSWRSSARRRPMSPVVAYDPAEKLRAYAHPERLVTTDWLAEHLDDPGLVVAESDEDVLLYETGHIPGAVKIDWFTDLIQSASRDQKR